MAINHTDFSGNLTRDAVLRTVRGDLRVLDFGVAINEKQKDRDTGEYVDKPVFVNCALFGIRAEKLAQYLTKGTKVAVSGKLHYSTYVKDDETRHELSVVVDQLDFLSQRKQPDNAPAVSQPVATAPETSVEPELYDEDVPF